jgi:hypothetical protein
MAKNTNNAPLTHTAYTVKWDGRRRRGAARGRWLEIGKGRIEKDGTAEVYIDLTPVGGFSGYVFLAPPGQYPLPPSPGHDDAIDSEDGETDSED